MKTNKNGPFRMKTVFKRTKNKKFELKILEHNKKLAFLKDSMDELENRLDIENQNLPNIQQRIRDIRKHDEINPSNSTISINKTMILIQTTS